MSKFTVALISIATIWKQLKCPLMDDWIMKTWHIHAMEYYSSLKNKKILPFGTTWMDLEDIMLN